MPKTDDGEFELVLGNRQLISVFLIMAILLGVFLAIGYIWGRNSGPVQTADGRSTAAGKPIVVDHQPLSETAASNPSPPQPAETAPRVEDEKPSPSPHPASTHPVATQEAERANPPPHREEKPVEPSQRAVPSEPGAGQYWQVVAASRPDAEIVTEALTKKGFRAMLAPAPKEGMFRVLVGPFSDAANMADTRAKLEAAGFKNPMMRKY